jgi:hypothetical protein
LDPNWPLTFLATSVVFVVVLAAPGWVVRQD